jgi:putative FmdB family regulatory protein
MPTYEYKCEKCGPFEIWQSIKDNALSACPTCGSKVERLISANVGFVLKGAGFYQNDYKTQPASKSEAKPAAEAGPSAGCGACGSPDPCPSGNN